MVVLVRIKAKVETSFFLAHYISEGSSMKMIFRRVTLKARKRAYQERLGLKLCTSSVRRTLSVKPGLLGRHWCEPLAVTRASRASCGRGPHASLVLVVADNGKIQRKEII